MEAMTYVGARMPAELAEALSLAAAMNDRSVSAELRVAIDEHLARDHARRRAEARQRGESMSEAELDAALAEVDHPAEGERPDGGPGVPSPASGAPSGEPAR
jgi:hypothetical protein